MEPDVEVDSWQLLPVRGDRFLLCTDGLTNEVSDDQIASTLRRVADANDAAQDLVRQARAHGGNDNITVVVVDVLDDDQRAERASAPLAAEPPPPPPSAGGSGGSGASSTATVDADLTTTTTTVPRVATRPLEPDEPKPRRFTWRVAAFLMVLAAVVGVAVIAVGWYARGTYYVGIDGDRIAIYKGRPGGLLWFKPTLEERKPLTVNDILPSRLADLRSGRAEPTKAAADRYVNQLRQEAAEARQPPTAPPPSTPPPGAP
jgi:protein phosphatase